MFGGRNKSSAKLTKKISLSPLFFIIFCFLLLSHRFYHQPATKQPPWPSSSSPSSVSLSSATSSSSSSSSLLPLPPSPQPKSPEPPDRHPQHDRRPSPPQVVLLPASPPSSSLRPLHAEFISACSGRIINFVIGPGQFWPSPNSWAGLARPPNVFFF